MKKLTLGAAIVSALLAAGCGDDSAKKADVTEAKAAQMDKVDASSSDAKAADTNKDSATTGSNPFFEEWDTPYGMPPFDKIKENVDNKAAY